MHSDDDTLEIFARNKVSYKRDAIAADNFNDFIFLGLQPLCGLLQFRQELVVFLRSGQQAARLLHCPWTFPVNSYLDKELRRMGR